jgi:hypothetical protein
LLVFFFVLSSWLKFKENEMSKNDSKKHSADFFNLVKKAVGGQITVTVDGVKHVFPVLRAEVQPSRVVMDFDMSGGSGLNEFIGLVINNNALNEKIDLPNPAVYILYQGAGQEWVAEKGWIRVEYQQGEIKVEGLLDNVSSGRPGNSVLTLGKFEVTLS